MSKNETPENPVLPPPTGWALAQLRLEDWLVWLTVTGIAWTAGLMLAVTAVETVLASLPAVVSLPLARLVGGALLGLIQWAFLVRFRGPAGRFVLFSALAWPLALLGYDLLAGPTQSTAAGLLGGLLGGAVMGYVQGLALEEKAEQRTWLYSAVAGWAVALGVGRQAVYDEVVPAANSWQYSLPLGIGWVFLTLLAVLTIVLIFPHKGLSAREMSIRMWPKRK